MVGLLRLIPPPCRATHALAFMVTVAACGSDDGVAPDPTMATVTAGVSTLGANPDPDGYLVTLDSRPPQRTTPNDPLDPANAGTSFGSVSEGLHTISLEDLAANCMVRAGGSGLLSAPNPYTWEVAPLTAISAVHWVVECT